MSPAEPDPEDIDAAASLISGRPVDVDAVLERIYHLPDWGRHLFYPVPRAPHLDFGRLERFDKLPWNNIGHRIGNPPGGNHTKPAERAVLAWAADLFFGLRAEGEWWGSLTNGGTSGNRAGLLAARESFPTADSGLTAAVAYYAESDHYSIPKMLRELCIPAVKVRARADGEMDYDDLYEQLHTDAPAIVNLTLGTTTTEAVTDPGKVNSVLESAGVPGWHLHGDGALSAIPLALDRLIDFEPLTTVSCSGHKFLGIPQPTGFCIGRRGTGRREEHVPYINTIDDSPIGSIDGGPALKMFYVIGKLGNDGLRGWAHDARAVAAYTTERLNGLGVLAWRFDHAFTVNFPTPPDPLLDAGWPVYRDGHGRSHLICMPGVTQPMVDTFIDAWAAALGPARPLPVQRSQPSPDQISQAS